MTVTNLWPDRVRRLGVVGLVLAWAVVLAMIPPAHAQSISTADLW